MSWAEYKKKREEQENMTFPYSQENNDSNNETSSWQKYKQKREEQKVQQTETLPVANKANTAPKTTTNLTEADLRKIEQNSGLKTGTLNLNKMQAQQQKFNNLQQKGNEELKSGAKLINEKQKKFNNFKNDAKIIGSNLKDSALSGGFQLLKTVGMMEDNAYNTQVDMRRILLENTINEREKRGLSTDELKEELNNSSLYKKSDVKPFYQEKINKINQRMAENTEKASNPVTKKIAGLSQSLGNNVVGGAVTAINPTAGFAYFTGSAMGSYYDEAVNERGMSDREARNYATIMGLMEGETDKYLAAENIKGLRKIMEGTGLKKSLESFGLEIGENFVQEAVMPAISELATKGIAGNEHLKYDFRTANGWKELARDSLSDGIDGALSAILLGGTTRGVASCVNLTNKARNGGKISKQEIKTAISDAQKSGVNVETILKDKIQENAKKRVLNLENETSGLPQNVQNNIEQQTIQTDTKTTQNQNMSQISDTNENNLKNTAINEINNSKISEQAKKDMLNAINSMENVDEESYNNIKQTLNEINKNELQTNSTYQDNLERRKNYVKYKDDINTYDNSAVEEVLSIIPTNRNGKRTVNQWLQVADEIGKRISGKSNAEIQEIAYKSWFENQPTKNITQYDSARKTSIGFQKLNSDMWVNKINEAVLKERTRLENTTNSQQVNLNNTQTNQESPIEDILNNKVDNNLETLYNNTKIGETTIIPVKTILSIQNSEGGYRTETQINNLKKDIEKNGITTPIEIYRKNNGTFAIENGNHRLKIAQELGIKDIPVKMVESWENIGVSTKNATKDFTQEYGGVYDDRITEKNSNIDEGRWNRERSRSGNNNQFGDSGRTRRNAELYETKSYSNEQTSINESKRNNSEQLKNPEKGSSSIGTRTNMQDILVSKATNNNKERVRDILSRNGSFSEQVDKYIADKLPSGDFLYLGETPTVLQNLGLPNNEVILKQSKLKTLMQESNNNTDKLHELPIETIKKIPEAIANPLNILQSSTDENSVVIITDLADANERPIIASIEVNYDGQIGNIDFLSNRLTSAYGKNNYDRFMKTEIAKGNLLYDIDEGIIKELPATRLQSPKGISSFVDTNNNVSTINNSIPQNNDSVKSNTITNNYAQQTQNDTHNNQNVAPSVANNSLPVGEYTGKQRKHYKSIMESAETTPQAKKIAKELLNSDTYVPETNKGQLERADARIMSSTPESELNSLSAKAINGEKISSVDIAVGERLIQYYSKTGNAVKLQEAIQTTAMAGTSAGQTVQALSLLNHQTPQGQAMWLQKSVDKMNNELARRKGGKINKDENGNIRVTNNKGVDITEKVELFNLTPEMIQNVVSSKNDTELNKNLNKVYEQLGQQVTRTTAQKIDAWRYFSMLANPKTHIRNITGNVAMGGVQGIKNKVAGVIEGVANKINPDMERSHTIKPASKEVKAFAKADIENVTDRLGLSENKYNPKTRLENSMRTFKSDVMENTVGKMFDLNNKALEVEDGWGLKAGYTKALSEYMTANNLTPDTITDKQLGKARNYAIQQAKEATFHQDSSIASLLNQLSNKNKFSKFILDSTLPFKKTPINVAKAGLEYSPVGLVKSAIYDTVQLRKGNITVNTYIDNISKGLTGSGIALVGYALADCGILKATGSDDEDREKFEESRGSQNYSVKIGDNTYSLDWLAPAGIPLFIGAECYELMQAQKEKKTSSSDEDELYNKAINTATNILDSFANAMNPMTEMSMLSGLTSALKSYDQDSSKMLASIGTNAVKSYVNQFVPTALGQVAKTTDQYERSTTSTQKGVLPKAIDTTRTQIMNKIPGLRQMLPIKTDIWGNEIEQSDNVIQRAFENAVFPWARKELNSNSVDKELVKVYKNTGDKAVLPDSINKEITINKQKYTMTSGEYSKYKKQYGENSYKLLNSLVTANGYKKMSDEEKRVAISKIYSYATEQIKVDYAKQNGLEYEQSTLSQVTNAIKKVNGNTSNYFEFIAKTQELDKDIEKIKTLANSNYDENTKKAIYENSLGKRDNKFNIMKETFTTNGLNTTKYLKYKSQEFESDKTDDGTLNGKTVNGSKKKKVWNYIEQMDITYTQKLLLYGLEYTPSNREQTQIVNYINSLPKTQQEKLEMLSKFQGFTIYKDGTFKF